MIDFVFKAISNALIILLTNFGLKVIEGLQIAYVYGKSAPMTLQPFSIPSMIPKPKLSIKEGYMINSDCRYKEVNESLFINPWFT